MGIIYCARNKVNGKRYIGQSVVSMESRQPCHKNSKNSSVIARALRKYGSENFEWTIMDDDVPDDEINTFEIEAIAVWKTLVPNGYNLRDGGARGRHSEQSKRKMSESHKGRKLSDETKRKLSEAGRNISDATRLKMSESHKGRKLSDETRQKLSESAKNMSDEHRRKLSESAKNKPPISDETRIKMSESAKKRLSMRSNLQILKLQILE